MNCWKLILLVAIIFLSTPNAAFADSVSISASVLAEFKLEIKSEPSNKTSTFTGIIIDCRGLGLKRVMSPVIKNETGKTIYGDKDLDYDKIVAMGMASYVTDIAQAKRAGSKPLIVKAVALDNCYSNPVLSDEDSRRVLTANEHNNFLKDLNVVFLMD